MASSQARAMRTSGAFLLLVSLCFQSMAAAFVTTHFCANGRHTSNKATENNKLAVRSCPARVETGLAMGFSLFPFGFGQKATNKQAGTGARLSAELFSMLTEDSAKPSDAAVMEKIEELEAAPGVEFNKNYLFDGPWRVLWKTNTAWQRYFDPLKNLADNRAYQWYKEDGSVTNVAQALGDKLYVTVDGQGTPASTSKKLPYEVNVKVSRGWLHALGSKIPLDFIKGKGTTFVVYNDAKLRVFRSDTGGVVVQTKADEVVPV